MSSSGIINEEQQQTTKKNKSSAKYKLHEMDLTMQEHRKCSGSPNILVTETCAVKSNGKLFNVSSTSRPTKPNTCVEEGKLQDLISICRAHVQASLDRHQRKERSFRDQSYEAVNSCTTDKLSTPPLIEASKMKSVIGDSLVSVLCRSSSDKSLTEKRSDELRIVKNPETCESSTPDLVQQKTGGKICEMPSDVSLNYMTMQKCDIKKSAGVAKSSVKHRTQSNLPPRYSVNRKHISNVPCRYSENVLQMENKTKYSKRNTFVDSSVQEKTHPTEKNGKPYHVFRSSSPCFISEDDVRCAISSAVNALETASDSVVSESVIADIVGQLTSGDGRIDSSSANSGLLLQVRVCIAERKKLCEMLKTHIESMGTKSPHVSCRTTLNADTISQSSGGVSEERSGPAEEKGKPYQALKSTIHGSPAKHEAIISTCSTSSESTLSDHIEQRPGICECTDINQAVDTEFSQRFVISKIRECDNGKSSLNRNANPLDSSLDCHFVKNLCTIDEEKETVGFSVVKSSLQNLVEKGTSNISLSMLGMPLNCDTERSGSGDERGTLHQSGCDSVVVKSPTPVVIKEEPPDCTYRPSAVGFLQNYPCQERSNPKKVREAPIPELSCFIKQEMPDSDACNDRVTDVPKDDSLNKENELANGICNSCTVDDEKETVEVSVVKSSVQNLIKKDASPSAHSVSMLDMHLNCDSVVKSPMPVVVKNEPMDCTHGSSAMEPLIDYLHEKKGTNPKKIVEALIPKSSYLIKQEKPDSDGINDHVPHGSLNKENELPNEACKASLNPCIGIFSGKNSLKRKIDDCGVMDEAAAILDCDSKRLSHFGVGNYKHPVSDDCVATSSTQNLIKQNPINFTCSSFANEPSIGCSGKSPEPDKGESQPEVIQESLFSVETPASLLKQEPGHFSVKQEPDLSAVDCFDKYSGPGENKIKPEVVEESLFFVETSFLKQEPDNSYKDCVTESTCNEEEKKVNRIVGKPLIMDLSTQCITKKEVGNANGTLGSNLCCTADREREASNKPIGNDFNKIKPEVVEESLFFAETSFLKQEPDNSYKDCVTESTCNEEEKKVNQIVGKPLIMDLSTQCIIKKEVGNANGTLGSNLCCTADREREASNKPIGNDFNKVEASVSTCLNSFSNEITDGKMVDHIITDDITVNEVPSTYHTKDSGKQQTGNARQDSFTTTTTMKVSLNSVEGEAKKKDAPVNSLISPLFGINQRSDETPVRRRRGRPPVKKSVESLHFPILSLKEISGEKDLHGRKQPKGRKTVNSQILHNLSIKQKFAGESESSEEIVYSNQQYMPVSGLSCNEVLFSGAKAPRRKGRPRKSVDLLTIPNLAPSQGLTERSDQRAVSTDCAPRKTTATEKSVSTKKSTRSCRDSLKSNGVGSIDGDNAISESSSFVVLHNEVSNENCSVWNNSAASSIFSPNPGTVILNLNPTFGTMSTMGQGVENVIVSPVLTPVIGVVTQNRAAGLNVCGKLPKRNIARHSEYPVQLLDKVKMKEREILLTKRKLRPVRASSPPSLVQVPVSKKRKLLPKKSSDSLVVPTSSVSSPSGHVASKSCGNDASQGSSSLQEPSVYRSNALELCQKAISELCRTTVDGKILPKSSASVQVGQCSDSLEEKSSVGTGSYKCRKITKKKLTEKNSILPSVATVPHGGEGLVRIKTSCLHRVPLAVENVVVARKLIFGKF